MTFNERLEFFKNKKGSDIQKIKSHINTIENDIYTFCPKTNKIIDTVPKEKKYKSLNKKLNNNSNSKENIRNKINYDYLNGLYLDYKKRKVRLKKLREENDKEDGISFIPSICKNNNGKLYSSVNDFKINNYKNEKENQLSNIIIRIYFFKHFYRFFMLIFISSISI